MPALAVSPIIAGQAVKGPTAKMMPELGLAPSAATVARHYEGLIDGFVVDTLDADVEVPAGARVFTTATDAQPRRSHQSRAHRARRRRRTGGEAGMSVAGIWAVVPVKAFVRAKSRLAAARSPPISSQTLVRAMLEDVLAALLAAPPESKGLAAGMRGWQLKVEPEALAVIAARHGARVLADRRARPQRDAPPPPPRAHQPKARAAW